ncbi:MAG: hypothetical protein KGO05_15825, partial [Chloroflexota bacterium]|nr:hypothetical protein [Chloroflexota bacterium]
FVGLRAEPIGAAGADTPADAPDAACLHTATSDTLVYSTTGRRVATAGVSGLIIVDTPEGLLVTTKQQAQLVKGLAEHRQRQQAQRAAEPEQADK